MGGQTKRVLIGRFPVISADAARQPGLGFALEWGRGAGKRIQIGAPTLSVAMEAYPARSRLRSDIHKNGIRQQFDLHMKDWLRLPLDEISKSMVVDRHRSMASIPSEANHTLKNFRTVWNHARRIHDLPECPTMAIEWFAENRDGTIIEDLPAWRRKIDSLENPIHQVFYELLLFTGFRKSEAFSLEWKNVYEDHIHLPMTKNGRSFDLPILQIHHEILTPIRNLGRQWVFPSPKSVSGHLSNPQRIERTKHAHRRTFATVAMEAGVMEAIYGRLLNHMPLSFTGQRYVKPSLDTLRPSMEVACEELLARSGKGSVSNMEFEAVYLEGTRIFQKHFSRFETEDGRINYDVIVDHFFRDQAGEPEGFFDAATVVDDLKEAKRCLQRLKRLFDEMPYAVSDHMRSAALERFMSFNGPYERTIEKTKKRLNGCPDYTAYWA